MSVIQAMSMELQHESTGAIKTLERIPSAKLSWKPHPKSMSLGELASHISDIPGWTVPTLLEKSLDLPANYQPWIGTSAEEIVARYRAGLAKAMESFGKVSDAAMMEPWTLSADGKAMFTMPRVVVMRSMILNHLVHHRAQLGVYLRLLDIPVPSIYGPSADEGNIGGGQ